MKKKVIVYAVIGVALTIVASLLIFTETKEGGTELSTVITPTAQSPNEVTLAIGQTGKVFGVSITLNDIVQDNRCPVDVNCIVAGAVTANVALKNGNQTETHNVLQNDIPYSFAGYHISIVKAAPDHYSKQTIAKQDYRITFHIDQ